MQSVNEFAPHSLLDGMTYLPRINDVNDVERAITTDPRTNIAELVCTAPFLPQRSMTTLAIILASSPPIVYTDVTTENVASDIGIQVGSPDSTDVVCRQVRTA